MIRVGGRRKGGGRMYLMASDMRKVGVSEEDPGDRVMWKCSRSQIVEREGEEVNLPNRYLLNSFFIKCKN